MMTKYHSLAKKENLALLSEGQISIDAVKKILNDLQHRKIKEKKKTTKKTKEEDKNKNPDTKESKKRKHEEIDEKKNPASKRPKNSNPEWIPDLDDTLKLNRASNYLKTVLWLSKYYFQSIPSWDYIYKYNHPPDIMDLLTVKEISMDFQLGKPMKPLVEMMAVLPATLSSKVPSCWAELMTNSTSKIKQFYPQDFERDDDNDPILPIVCKKTLEACLEEKNGSLSPQEEAINEVGKIKFIMDGDHPLNVDLSDARRNKRNTVILNPAISGGINGSLILDEDVHINSQFFFEPPVFPYNIVYKTGMLPSTIRPQRTLMKLRSSKRKKASN